MAYENVGKLGQDAMDTTLKSVSAVTRGFQQIAVENGEFCKRSIEQSTQAVEKLSQVRSFDKVVEVQTEYARAAYEAWMSQANKMGELYVEIAREAYKPFERNAYAAADFAEKAGQ